MQRTTSIALTTIGGYVDTLTFVSLHGLFAAHVTGNFVVFGAALARGITPDDYIKLIAFPVFVLAAGAGAVLYAVLGRNIGWLLLVQAGLFALVAAFSYGAPDMLSGSALGLLLVAAMGLQNALHRYVPGPMTTVMTGTVMNGATATAERLFKLPPPTQAKPSGARFYVLAFAAGCVSAGFVAQHIGLLGIALPAAVLVALATLEATRKTEIAA